MESTGDSDCVGEKLKKKKKKRKIGPTHLWEIEEGWLTEQDVSQEDRATRQNFNLVFTEMVTPQEFSKVPGNRRGSGRQRQPLWRRTHWKLKEKKTATHCCSSMEKTTDWAMTKQFGSTMPSSPQILAEWKDKRKKKKNNVWLQSDQVTFRTAEALSLLSFLPTISFRICSVMGMGLAASGEMYLVKMVTASFSIPAKTQKPTTHHGDTTVHRGKSY